MKKDKTKNLDDMIIKLKKTIKENEIIILASKENMATVMNDDGNIDTKQDIYIIEDDLFFPGKIKCRNLISKNHNFKCEELWCEYFEVDELEAKTIRCERAFFYNVTTDILTANKWILGKELKCKRLTSPMATVMNLQCDENSIQCQKVISGSTTSSY